MCYEQCYNTESTCGNHVSRTMKYHCDYASAGGKPSCGVSNDNCAGQGGNHPCPIAAEDKVATVGEPCKNGVCGEYAYCGSDNMCYEQCYNTGSTCGNHVSRTMKYHCDYAGAGGKPKCGVKNAKCSGQGVNYPCPVAPEDRVATVGQSCQDGECGDRAWCGTDNMCYETCYHTETTCGNNVTRTMKYHCDYSSSGGRPSCGVTNKNCIGRGGDYPCSTLTKMTRTMATTVTTTTSKLVLADPAAQTDPQNFGNGEVPDKQMTTMTTTTKVLEAEPPVKISAEDLGKGSLQDEQGDKDEETTSKASIRHTSSFLSLVILGALTALMPLQ